MPDVDILFGAVKVDGTRDHGSNGWSSEFLSVGKYKVTFNNRFEKTPSIVVTTERPGVSGSRAPIIPEIVLTSDATRRGVFEVNFRTDDGTTSSTQFNFIAIAKDD